MLNYIKPRRKTKIIRGRFRYAYKRIDRIKNLPLEIAYTIRAHAQRMFLDLLENIFNLIDQ